jgi:hypothetical protein
MRQYNAYSKKKNTLCSEMVGYCGGCCDEVLRRGGEVMAVITHHCMVGPRQCELLHSRCP